MGCERTDKQLQAAYSFKQLQAAPTLTGSHHPGFDKIFLYKIPQLICYEASAYEMPYMVFRAIIMSQEEEDD